MPWRLALHTWVPWSPGHQLFWVATSHQPKLLLRSLCWRQFHPEGKTRGYRGVRCRIEFHLLLIKEDDEILFAFELSCEFLSGQHAYGAFFRLDLLWTFHKRYFRNYRRLSWRDFRALCLPSWECGNVRKTYLGQNRILNLDSAGHILKYAGRQICPWPQIYVLASM